jgi:hypothetical protein
MEMKKLLSIALLMSFGALNMCADEVKKEGYLTKLKKKAGAKLSSAKESAKKSLGMDDISTAKKLAEKLKRTGDKKYYKELVALKKNFASAETIREYEAIVRQARKDLEKTEGLQEIDKKNKAIGEENYRRNKEATKKPRVLSLSRAEREERAKAAEERQAEFDAESLRKFREEQALRRPELEREVESMRKSREEQARRQAELERK